MLYVGKLTANMSKNYYTMGIGHAFKICAVPENGI